MNELLRLDGNLLTACSREDDGIDDDAVLDADPSVIARLEALTAEQDR
jgi:hypothetical protein